MTTATLPMPQTSATLSERDLELRKNFIGASESAAILGVSPYANATDIYRQKIGLATVETNRVMQIGQLFEPILLEYAAQELGVAVHKGRRRVHPDAPLQATPDGFVKGQRILIEAKKVNLFTYLKDQSQWGESMTDQVPMHYLVQIQHSLEVLTASDGEVWDTAYLVVCIGDDDFRMYEIHRNVEIGKKIVDVCTHFMKEHIDAQVEPKDQPAHMDAYSQVKRGLNTHKDVSDRLMRRYVVGKNMEKRAKAIVDGVKRKVLQLGDEFEIFETQTCGKFTYKDVTTRRIDVKALRAEQPDIAEQYTSATSARKFCGYPNKKVK